MKKSVFAATFAFLAATCSADETLAGASNATTNASATKVFTTLPSCERVEGAAMVREPGGEWVAVEEGKFYPFGSSFRAEKNGRLTVAFGPAATAKVADGAEFATRVQKLGEKTRTIVLVRGTVDLNLPRTLAPGSFAVVAPGFVVKNPAGESRLTYTDCGDGDEAVLRCVTGTMGLEGLHFDIATMRAADEIRIRTSRDRLSTILNGTSGDYVVTLDHGLRLREELDSASGEWKKTTEKCSGEFHLTPLTKVVINRALPALGERMSVFIMAFDAAGRKMGEGVSFCEGRAEVSSGDLVPKQEMSKEDIAMQAAEATVTKAATDVEEPEKSPESETSDEPASEE